MEEIGTERLLTLVDEAVRAIEKETSKTATIEQIRIFLREHYHIKVSGQRIKQATDIIEEAQEQLEEEKEKWKNVN